MVFVSHMSRFEIGRLGVALFFVLSGYWISHLWDRQTGDNRVGIFFINRFLRIWPLYIVAVFLAYLLFRNPLHPTAITLLGVASAPGPHQLGVEWSLDVEAQFYLILPFLAMSRMPLVALVPAFAFGWFMFDMWKTVTVAMYLPAFAAGIWMYRRRRMPLLTDGATAGLAFLALSAMLFLLPETRAVLTGARDLTAQQHDLIAMVWMLPLIPYIEASLRVKSSPLDRHLGNLSYPFYLVHEPVILAAKPFGLSKPLIALVAAGVAVAFYLLLDVPFEKWRYRLLDRLRRRQGQPQPAAVVASEKGGNLAE